jgi:hypothetical protein
MDRPLIFMRKLFLTLALLLTIGALITWLVTGAKVGWTETKRKVETTDEVTGITGITYEPHFVAGVDFLGAAFLGAAVLAGLSFFFKAKSTTNKPVI